MAKKIKKKYAFKVNSYNTEGTFIRISKKVFDECLKNYQDIYNKLGPLTDEWDDSSEHHIDIEKFTIEQETYKQNTYMIEDGATTVFLYEFICKDGYCFIK